MNDLCRWIGDIHGDPHFERYAELIKTPLPTRQVGDFGLGFGTPPAMDRKDRFHRGNHDNPALCRAHPNWIPDGTLDGSAFHIGGAQSHDRARLVEGETWWRDEEISLPDWEAIFEAYARARPRILATHDVAESLRDRLFPPRYEQQSSRTRQALDALLEIHKPEIWIFGHWHQARDEVLHGIRCICLAPLSFVDLPI